MLLLLRLSTGASRSRRTALPTVLPTVLLNGTLNCTANCTALCCDAFSFLFCLQEEARAAAAEAQRKRQQEQERARAQAAEAQRRKQEEAARAQAAEAARRKQQVRGHGRVDRGRVLIRWQERKGRGFHRREGGDEERRGRGAREAVHSCCAKSLVNRTES
jgi:hypothetical protein